MVIYHRFSCYDMALRAKNKLDELLKTAYLAAGAERQVWLERIRAYIRNTPPDQVRREVAELDNPNALRMLMAAGVPQYLADTFFFVWSRVTGEAGV